MSKFYKCDYMDSGINFERWGVYVCCKTAHEGGGMPVLAQNYSELDWDKVFEQKKIWKAQIANGTPPEKCKGCPSVLETDEITEDLAFNFVDVNSFVNCNSRCCYCDCWSIQNFTETSLFPRFKELFDKKLLKNSDHGYIQFAGGEPALMKDFEKIIDLCLQNGMEHFIVNSNGIKFSDGIEKLLDKTNTNLFVSIDSGCSETYENIKNVPCFDKVVENLTRYAKAQKRDKSRVWSKYIIVPDKNDNLEEIIKWYELTMKMGIRAVVLDVEREWFKHNNRKITANMEKMISEIQNRCAKDNVKIDYYEQLKCLYGIH